jgi:ElaA protein
VSDLVVGKSWNELTLQELYDFLKLRCDVFMLEQKAEDEEMDHRDEEAATRHFWIADERGCAAYLRVLWNADAEHLDANRVVGRVATRTDRRGEGLTRRLMERVLADFEGEAMMLHAQDHVVGLYARFGFEAFGEPYDEAGIAHRSMYLAGVAPSS